MLTQPYTLILSDVHLSTTAPDITRRFLQFLESHAVHAHSVYLLGDLFEVWIGDDAPGEFGNEISAALKQLSNRGITIYFMHGNRDFLIGEQFAHQSGMHLLNDPCVVNLHGQPVLLSHGDAWCTDDIEYQAFRLHRSQPENVQQFLTLPVDQRLAFAQSARDASQKHTNNSAANIMDVNQAAINEAFTEHNVQTIIHGHTHRPADHQYANHNQRIVLGDWYSQASWLTISAEGIHRHGPTNSEALC